MYYQQHLKVNAKRYNSVFYIVQSSVSLEAGLFCFLGFFIRHFLYLYFSNGTCPLDAVYKNK